MPGTSPTHREPGAWRYGTQLQKKYIFIRKALCRGARLRRTELIPPTPLDGTWDPKGRPALAISSAFLLARSNPRGRGEGGIGRNQLDPTPGMARLWRDRQWRAVPGARGAGAWGLLPVTSLVMPWVPNSNTLPLQCTMSPTDWSGVWEASGSVTAEYTVGTSSTTSTAYAIDNTATKKCRGDMPRTDPPPALGWRLGQLPAVLPCAGRASCQTRAGSRQQGTDGEDQVLGQGRLKEKMG